MNIVLLGAPGAGKGTQADFLAARLGGVHISPGEFFRGLNRAGKLPAEEKQRMEAGFLVSDGYFTTAMTDYIKSLSADKAIVFDGAVRNLHQVQLLADVLASSGRAVNKAVLLTVTPETVRTRVAHRDSTGGSRADDDPAALTRRIDVFDSEIPAVIKHYEDEGKLLTIDGEPPIEAVRQSIFGALSL